MRYRIEEVDSMIEPNVIVDYNDFVDTEIEIYEVEFDEEGLVAANRVPIDDFLSFIKNQESFFENKDYDNLKMKKKKKKKMQVQNKESKKSNNKKTKINQYAHSPSSFPDGYSARI